MSTPQHATLYSNDDAGVHEAGRQLLNNPPTSTSNVKPSDQQTNRQNLHTL